MSKSSSNSVIPGKIPVLFDVVERGSKAPPENLMKPPEDTEFRLGDYEGNEDPTVLPGGTTTESQPTSYDELANADTVESPVVTQEMLDGSEAETQEIVIPTEVEPEPDRDSTVFLLEDITSESPTVPASMIIDTPPPTEEVIEQVTQQLMPQLEDIVRQTVKQVLDSRHEEAAEESAEPASSDDEPEN